ncbi:MAG: DUF1857 family protein [Methylobacteriaceae bacterium]|nr:DUF1857 family protein [Methylobacteriaceae bacterium]
MHAVSLSIPVNPPGAEPRLTRDEVWRGLVMKAENAVPFVPGMTRCEVVERLSPEAFWREAEYRGETLREKITLTAPVQVLFEREPDSPNAGWITNVLSDLGDDLVLTFTFAVRFPGTAEGSAAEREAAEGMRATYGAAVAATLATVRGLAARGAIG